MCDQSYSGTNSFQGKSWKGIIKVDKIYDERFSSSSYGPIVGYHILKIALGCPAWTIDPDSSHEFVLKFLVYSQQPSSLTQSFIRFTLWTLQYIFNTPPATNISQKMCFQHSSTITVLFLKKLKRNISFKQTKPR